MKDIIRISAMGLTLAALMTTAMILPGKNRELPAALTPEEISWIEFCRDRGYDVDDNSEETVNEFLDTWRGSTEEEEALLIQCMEP